MTPATLTGCPESFVGVKRALSAACTAASLNVWGPSLALAEITLPASSITTSTVTTPDILIFFAVSGYMGLGNETAVPLRTPPEIGLRRGFGTALGGSDSTSTIEALVLRFGVTSCNSAELITFRLASFEGCGTVGADFGVAAGPTLTGAALSATCVFP